jgi:hypothetical protein
MQYILVYHNTLNDFLMLNMVEYIHRKTQPKERHMNKSKQTTKNSTTERRQQDEKSDTVGKGALQKFRPQRRTGAYTYGYGP